MTWCVDARAREVIDVPDVPPDELFKVSVTGKAFSLYKPDGENREWQDNFDDPDICKKKLYGGDSAIVYWNRHIPDSATAGHEARVKFTLKL